MKTSTVRQIRMMFPVFLFSFASSAHWPWTIANLDHFRSRNGLHLTNAEISLITSVLHWGRLTSALVEVFLLQKCGRKTHLIAGAFFMMIGTPALLSETVFALSLARFFAGLGTGFGDIAVRMYVGEIVPKKTRGALITSVSLVSAVGILLTYAAPMFLGYNHFVHAIIAVNALLLFSTFDLVESPYFLVLDGDKAKALRSLTWLNDYEHKEASEELKIMLRHTEKAMNVVDLIQNFRRPEIYRSVLLINSMGVILTILSAGTLSFTNVIFPKMDSISSSAFSVGLSSLILLATCAASFVVDRFGRRSLLVYGFGIQSIVNAIIASLYYLNQHNGFQFTFFPWLMFGFITLTFLMFQFACFIPYNAVRGEIFPTNFKNIAVAVNLSLNSITNSIMSYLFLLIIAAYGIYLIFLIFCISCVFGFSVVYVMLPETKKKSLIEIQCMLRKDTS